MKKLIPLAVLLIAPLVQVFAQEGKLKNVQDGSVWAPAVKVDGTLKEWDDTFQAYNKTTKIFYTVCNDDKYLYFVVKSIDPTNTNKITAGGITLVINTDGKKKDKDAYSITYPIIPRQGRGQGGGRGAGGFGGGRGAGGFGGGGFGGGGQNGGRRAPDSATIAAQHKQNIESAKDIRVLGFKDITDTLISIYNEYSIKAAMGYDPLGNFDYELAVPFKELNIDPASAKELAYHVTLNGLQIPQNFDRQNQNNQNGFGGDNGGNGGGNAAGVNAGGGGAAGGGRGGAAGGGRGGRGGGAPGAPGGGGGNPRFDNLDMFSPTDFWGKYALAKNNK